MGTALEGIFRGSARSGGYGPRTACSGSSVGYGQLMITRGGDGNVDERDSTSCSNSRPSLPTMQVASRSCG